MYGSIVRGQIERTNRNLLVSNAVLLTLILAYALITTLVTGHNQFFPDRAGSAQSRTAETYAPADMSRPTAIVVEDLDSAVRLGKLTGHAVRLTDMQSVDLGFPVWNASQRGAVEDLSRAPNYRYSERGERLFVILPPDSTAGPVFTGVLRPLEEQDANQVTTVLHSRGIQKFTLMPFALDGLDHSKTSRRTALNLPSASIPLPNLFYLLLGAVPVWNICKALQRGKRLETHPLVRRLSKYGRIDDIARAIDAECAAGVVKITPAQFTASWLLVPTFYTCIALPLDEIVWIYERVYVTRGRSYAVCLRDRQGGYDEFTCALFQVNKILSYMSQVRPWVVLVLI